MVVVGSSPACNIQVGGCARRHRSSKEERAPRKREGSVRFRAVAPCPATLLAGGRPFKPQGRVRFPCGVPLGS